MKLAGPLSATRFAICCGLGCCVLGALATPARAALEAEEIAPGIYTGTAPMNADDYAALRCLQVHTVVDMRKFRPLASHRERGLAEQYGMVYRHIPVGFLPTKDRSPDCVLRLLSDPDHRPIYIHCQLGRDRTGLVVAIHRVRYLGWSPQAAYAAMQRQEFNPLLRNLDRYFWQSVSL